MAHVLGVPDPADVGDSGFHWPAHRTVRVGNPPPAASDFDAVFRALADPTRRELLDRLFEQDGQSLIELAARYDMTRQGVMNHLAILEKTGLITTRREGRHKLHFLNPIPIRLLQRRWIRKYEEPWLEGMINLKQRLEGAPMNPGRELKHVFQIVVRASAEELWQAITDPATTERYFHDTRIRSDFQVGSPVTYELPDGEVAVRGEILEVDPPQRLSMTWQFRDHEGPEDPPSRVTWEIEALGETCRLTVVHDDFESKTRTYEMVGEGWPPVLSSLKSLVETGEPLPLEV